MNGLLKNELTNGFPMPEAIQKLAIKVSNYREQLSLTRQGKVTAIQYVLATLSVIACTYVCYAGDAWISQDDAIMLYFATTYLLAYRMSLGPAIWAVILSIACFDAVVAPPAFQLLWNHAASFIVLFPAVVLQGYRTSKLKEHANNLEERVEERTKQLALTNKKLSEEAEKQRITEDKLRRTVEELGRSNAMLSQFARIASHDLKEPLCVIQGYVSLLNSRYEEKLDDDGKDFLGYIVDASKRMTRLINGILQHASVSNNTRKFEDVNVSTCLDDACANLEQRILESGAVISRGPLPNIMADRAMLTQLFQNLIANSLKFQQAGVTPRIHITAEHVDTSWNFVLQDNGIGIEPEYTDRIFGMFKRLHSAEKYPGHGLGLAICKAIIDHHNGKIWVESEKDNGSRFCFNIPAKS